MIYRSRFSGAVRNALLSSGFTKAEFATRLGVSRPTLDAWLDDSQRPTLQSIEKVARYVGCDPRDLIGEEVISDTPVIASIEVTGDGNTIVTRDDMTGEIDAETIDPNRPMPGLDWLTERLGERE